MRRHRRLGAFVFLVVAAFVTQASAAKRDATRDFPQGFTCPGNFFDEPSRPGQPLTLTAVGPTATLTFEASNNAPLNVTIELDHVMVVEKSVFDKYRIAYPGAYPGNPALRCVPGSPGYDPLKCYGIGLFKNPGEDTSDPLCYGSVFVTSVFDRGKVARFTKQWPFDDDFDHALQPWILTGTAAITPKSRTEDNVPASHVLTLIKEGDQNKSTASIVVGNLIKTRQYVVDFTWSVFPDGGFENGDAVMTVDFH